MLIDKNLELKYTKKIYGNIVTKIRVNRARKTTI